MMSITHTPHNFSSPTLHDAKRWRGLRVGLFGGSFNPPHKGHLHIARVAQIQFKLDFVWWLVTPKNPLKDAEHAKKFYKRYDAVEKMLAPHPHHIPTLLESELQTSYTYETVALLKDKFSQTEFLWICGMDNAHIFHKWDRWRELLHLVPITFIARPPAPDLVQNSPIRRYNQVPHYYAANSQKDSLKKPGIYWIKGIKMLDISSTQIRKNTFESDT